MKIQDPEIFKIHAEFCKTIANEKRLMIMTLLAEKELCVGDLAEAIGASVSNISQHLNVLRSRNIVRSRKEAQTVYYSLVHPRLYEACVIIRTVLLEDLEQQGKKAKEIHR